MKKSVLILNLLLLSVTFFKAHSQVVEPFETIYPGPGDPETIRGGMQVIGNSILGIDGTIPGQGVITPNTEGVNFLLNNGMTQSGYIDIDSSTDPSYTPLFLNLDTSNLNNATFSSSSAELKINQTSREGWTTVRKAFLYWAAIYPYAIDTNIIDNVGVNDITKAGENRSKTFSGLLLMLMVIGQWQI